MSKNTFAVLYTTFIVAGFFTAGIFDVLDYFIVKALLFVSFLLLVIYLIIVVLKDIENKNHME